MRSVRDTFFLQIQDLLEKDTVQAMSAIKQHIPSVNCLEHCLFVSYLSFRVCRILGNSGKLAARAGLLHDLFLYDQHAPEHRHGHWKKHPAHALEQARKITMLSQREENGILGHMWPLTKERPRYLEAWVVNFVDTLCAFLEWMHIYHLLGMKQKLAWS